MPDADRRLFLAGSVPLVFLGLAHAWFGIPIAACLASLACFPGSWVWRLIAS